MNLMVVLYIFGALMLLVFMIVVHEFGHYIAAKILRFRVKEFAIGFGRPLFKYTRKNGEIFSIRVLPLGGYCAFEGDEDDPAAVPGGASSYQKDPDAIPFNKMAPWKRLIVLFSGGFANMICGVIFAFIVVAAFGYYQHVEVTRIDENSHLVGIVQVGDVVTEINGSQFPLLSNFGVQLGPIPVGEEFYFTLYRENPATGIMERHENVVVRKDVIHTPDGTFRGMGLNFEHAGFANVSFGSAIGYAFVFSWELTKLIFDILWQLITFQISLSNLGGTLSAISVMSDVVSAGILPVLIMIPLISMNLAIFNLLPIPALDGARMVFTGIEWIRGRPVNPDLEGRIHMIGLICLLAFMVIADLNFLIFQRLF